MVKTNRNSYVFSSLLFFAIAIFLVIYGCPPGRSTLQKDKAKIIRIVRHSGTRYNIELLTTKGNKLSCVENTLRKWPPAAFDRCPLEKLEPFVGKTVSVLHDGKYIYEVKYDDEVLLSYNVFRRFQIGMSLLGLLMAGIAVVILRKAILNR